MSLPSIESVTTQALSLALDAASLRHRVIATNIANANTPGFAALKINFETLVSQGATGSVARSPAAELRWRAEPSAGADGAPHSVNLDAEVAAMAQNNLHQQMLIRALHRHLGFIALAANEGRR